MSPAGVISALSVRRLALFDDLCKYYGICLMFVPGNLCVELFLAIHYNLFITQFVITQFWI